MPPSKVSRLCFSESLMLTLDMWLSFSQWNTRTLEYVIQAEALNMFKWFCFISSVVIVAAQSPSCIRLVTLWTAAPLAPLPFRIYWSLYRFMSIESAMQSNHLILCTLLLLLPSVFPSIRVVFRWVGSSHQVAKVSELQLQHQSLQWIFRVDFL